MGITPEARRRIEEKKRLVDQFIVDPNFLIPEVHIDPFTPHLRTNNFVQRGLSHVLGRRVDNEKWAPLAVDDEGKIILSDDVSRIGFVSLGSREAEDISIFESLSLPATSIVTHEGIDVSQFSGKTLLISSTASVSVYVQFSDNLSNWYDWCDATGSAISWTVNNVKKAIGIDDHSHYVRIVVHNSSASAVTCTMVLEVSV